MNSLAKEIILFLIWLVNIQELKAIISDDTIRQAKYFLEKNPLIDTHNDLSYFIRTNFKNQLTYFDLEDVKIYLLNSSLIATSNVTHTDLKRLNQGKLSGQFWAIFSDCNSLAKDALSIQL